MPSLPSLGTRRPRRTAAVGLAAVGLALVSGGCSSIERMHTAAIVNGESVTTDDLATATSQYNAFAAAAGGNTVTQAEVLPYLIQAKVIVPWAQRTGDWKPDASFDQAISRVGDASDSTKELFEAIIVTSQEQQGQLSQAAAASLASDLKAASVTVSPRYGTFDAASPTTLTAITPNWISPSSRAIAPAAPAQ